MRPPGREPISFRIDRLPCYPLHYGEQGKNIVKIFAICNKSYIEKKYRLFSHTAYLFVIMNKLIKAQDS